jgi:puromycin-sensitive aminopeptidase
MPRPTRSAKKRAKKSSPAKKKATHGSGPERAPAKRQPTAAKKKKAVPAKAPKRAPAKRQPMAAKKKKKAVAAKAPKRGPAERRPTAAKKKKAAVHKPKLTAVNAFRLDPNVRAQAYRIHIDVDPSRSQRYSGRVEINVQIAKPVRSVELHAAELEIDSARIAADGGEHNASIALNPARETITLTAKASVQGEVTLRVGFSGALRTDLRGLYGARSGERSYAFTQLEAADARRFFPCFDEPDHKAAFTLSVHTAQRNTVISNNPIATHDDHSDGTKTVTFSPTPKLSTYLVALAVGELVVSEPVHAGDVPIRVVHVPGNEHMTAFALDTARECLTRLSSYFALPYPYDKLDLVAVPDFEIGAMENAGAVFFRETLLLVDEDSVSLQEKKRAAEVICHELAHMWYGNLVTMRWWDDLWLNEAFATWMAFDIVAKWRPEWQMWNDFGHSRNSALTLDALANTHAIYTEVRTPSEATENFDLITYEKGAAVVRMIEGYLGPEVFQRGVQRYIARHREQNTVASDLWRALSEAAGEDVDAVVRPFIEQPGFPLVHVEQSDGRVHLRQERFDARGPRAPKLRGKAQVWHVPWVGKLGGHGGDDALVRHVLTEREETVELGRQGAHYLYGNADEGGFFRPLHGARELPALVAALPELDVRERLGFVQHQWALVYAGYAELPSFLPLLAALAHEPQADVLRALLPPCAHLLDDVARAAGPREHAALQAHLIEVFGPALSELGWGRPGEMNTTRLRRTELLQLVAVLGESAAVCEEAEERCASYLRDRELDPNLIAAVLTIGARRANAARFEQLLDASENEPTPQARRRFRMALADVRDPALVRDVLTLCLGPRIPTQDVALVVARLLHNPEAQEPTFEFIQARWSELKARMPAMLVSRLIEATPALRTEERRRKLMRFFAKHPLPTAARALRQADERFALDAAFRERAIPQLRAWLADAPTAVA